MPAADAPTPALSLDAIDVDALRARWSKLAGEVGRDLASDDSLNVSRRLEQMAEIEAYIALVERDRRAKQPRWRRWEFWRRVTLVLAVGMTIALLFMAFTHPPRVVARFDVLASSLAIVCDEPLRLPVGSRFETISVTGLERLDLPAAGGQRVITGRGISASNGRDSPGRLDWITIPAGATVRLRSADREAGVSVVAPAADASPAAIRWNMNPGGTLNVTASESGETESIALEGASGATIEGSTPSSAGRLEATILRAADDDSSLPPLRLSRFSGVRISSLQCSDDNEVAVRRRSTVLSGAVSFPDVEVPPVTLDEAMRLTIVGLDATIVRVELTDAGVRLVCEGEAGDVRAGLGEQRSLLPSRLEFLFARRFRMYVTGVLLYAVVFILALLKGDKQSIGEGFQPRSLMKMVHGGGHL